MFFGHEVKSNQGKSTPLTLKVDTKLSQAVLDPAGKAGNKKEPVSLVVEVGGKSYILAVLDPTKSWQCPLDIVFAAGTDVKFYIRGQGTVHLTGYEEGDDFGIDMSSEGEESSEEKVTKKVPTKAKSPATNGVKPTGAPKQDSDEESSDDDDFNVNDIEDDDDLDDDDDDDDENLSFGEIDTSDDEMDDSDDDDDDDDN